MLPVRLWPGLSPLNVSQVVRHAAEDSRASLAQVGDGSPVVKPRGQGRRQYQRLVRNPTAEGGNCGLRKGVVREKDVSEKKTVKIRVFSDAAIGRCVRFTEAQMKDLSTIPENCGRVSDKSSVAYPLAWRLSPSRRPRAILSSPRQKRRTRRDACRRMAGPARRLAL